MGFKKIKESIGYRMHLLRMRSARVWILHPSRIVMYLVLLVYISIPVFYAPRVFWSPFVMWFLPFSLLFFILCERYYLKVMFFFMKNMRLMAFDLGKTAFVIQSFDDVDKEKVNRAIEKYLDLGMPIEDGKILMEWINTEMPECSLTLVSNEDAKALVKDLEVLEVKGFVDSTASIRNILKRPDGGFNLEDEDE